MSDRSRELASAAGAVRAAARVCRRVQENLVDHASVEKEDKSPVTVADFASQALVCAALETDLPADAVVGEEDSASLRSSPPELLEQVVRLVGGERGSVEAETVLAWIDRGGADASAARFWTLDPIDGTKGFLRGEQYAIALALLEDGEVQVGALGCPNLTLDGRPGALFTAERGKGARVWPLWDEAGEGREVRVARVSSPAEARFCESVESGHSNQSDSARIAADLGIRTEPVRIDSQCKYATVARGDASIYLRLPTRKDYREKIWDHAAGALVVESAGGRVSDAFGAPLDFTCGRTLERNRGVVATGGSIHDEVIAAVARTREAQAG